MDHDLLYVPAVKLLLDLGEVFYIILHSELFFLQVNGVELMAERNSEPVIYLEVLSRNCKYLLQQLDSVVSEPFADLCEVRLDGVILALQDAGGVIQEVRVDDVKRDDLLIFQSSQKVAEQVSVEGCKDVEARLVLPPLLEGSIVVRTALSWWFGGKGEDVDVGGEEADENVELYVPKVVLALLEYLVEDLLDKRGASFLQGIAAHYLHQLSRLS